MNLTSATVDINYGVYMLDSLAKDWCAAEQAAFTPKELRELLNMEGVDVHIPQDTLVVTPVDEAEMKATRMKRRVYDILQKAALKKSRSALITSPKHC